MNIKKRKPNIADINIEKKILTGMITNSGFLENMLDIYRPDLFKMAYMNSISNWCVDFYKKYGKSPNRHIEDIFKEDVINDDSVKLVEKFLYNLSDEFERTELDSPTYMYEDAVKYFERFKALQVADEAKKLIISGNVEEAQNLYAKYVPVDTVKINNLNIYDPRISVFSKEMVDKNFLFRLPGELGDFIGNINKGELIAAVAPSGIGKSWWLQFLSEVASMYGVDVLFISMEMSQNQMLTRFRSSLMKRPIEESELGYFLLPKFDCYKNQIGACSNFKRINKIKLFRDGKLPEFGKVPSAYKMCSICRGDDDFVPAIWYEKITKKIISDNDFERFYKKAKPVLGRRGKIHFVEFPMNTLTMKKMRSYISVLKSKLNFRPKLIVTDYADKILSLNKNQYRHKIGEIWGDHKSLAQELEVGVLTASQSNTSRNPYKNIDRGSWEEAILKLNLVDGAFSINQNPEEKEQHLYRIRQMKKRSQKYSLIHECHVINMLELGRPYIDGVVKEIPKEELNKNKKEENDYAKKDN